MKTICGIDLGTQSCKLVVYDPSTKSVLSRTQAELDLTARDDGAREQDAAWYEAAVAACFAGLPTGLRSSISAIGVSGQQHGFVPLGADGNALYPVKLWCDTSTGEECDELTRLAGGEAALLKETGLLMLPGYTAPKILWLKKYHPELYAQLRHVLLPHDYVNFLLTGSYVTEFGDASGTALFDVRARRWSDRICSLIDPGLRACMPELTAPDGLAGAVSRAAAARYGIPAGIPVSAGGGDNMMGAIGTGAVRDGSLTMSLGTSGTLYGYADAPVVDPEGKLAAFCSSTGGWLPLLCTMNCTVASEQLRGLLGLDLAAFNAAAEAAPIGSEGVAVIPFFNGERIPNLPNGRASLNGLTAANFKPRNIARAAMEAAIFGMRIGLESFKALGYRAKEIRLIGGGAKSPLWRRIVADLTGLPVKVPAFDDAAAMGAAIQALWARENLSGRPIGIAKLCAEHAAMENGAELLPEPAAVAAYEKAYANYERYLRALGPLYT